MNAPFAWVLPCLAALLAAGCGEGRAEKQPVSEPAPAATYKAGRGLQLTPEAAAFVGLERAEVAVRELAGAPAAVAVPAAAILRTIKGDFVYVGNGGWFLRTPVTVGGGDGAYVAVAEGLYEGDEVVVRGARELWLAEIQAVNGGVGCADGH